jgi:hypothetical protein
MPMTTSRTISRGEMTFDVPGQSHRCLSLSWRDDDVSASAGAFAAQLWHAISAFDADPETSLLDVPWIPCPIVARNAAGPVAHRANDVC